MMLENATMRSLAGSPLVGGAVFAALIAGFMLTIGAAVSDIVDRRQSLAASEDMLDQLKSRNGSRSGNGATLTRSGSPFLEGPTLTVAGASLLQAVAGVIAQAGGTLQSSQIDVEGDGAKDGFVRLVVSCEIDQVSLQKLLYDIEAGMPFLFIDQFDAQMPQVTAAGDAGAGRMRIILGVSGQWRRGR